MENTENQGQSATMDGRSELEVLKDRARIMGINHSNNIGVDALRAKINSVLNQTDEEDAEDVDNDNGPTDEQVNALDLGAQSISKPVPTAVEPEKPRVMSLRQHLYQDAMRLVRCQITNLDPKKKDLPGEIITVANEYIGTVRKFVPFGEHTDNGYHIPYCIYQMLEARRFVHITTTKDPKTRQPIVRSRDAKEFAIVVMDPLTKEELRELAIAQSQSGTIDTGRED